MSKVTKATFKSFLRKNSEKLLVREESSFDGMVDCVERIKNPQFLPTKPASINCQENTCGIAGIWLVGGSRNTFSVYEDDQYFGYHYYNCCGSGTVVIKK
jgi:hypothetical protein